MLHLYICHGSHDVQVLACVRVEDTLVLGTTQGLATVREGTVVHCEGLHTPVHLLQVLIVTTVITPDTQL